MIELRGIADLPFLKSRFGHIRSSHDSRRKGSSICSFLSCILRCPDAVSMRRQVARGGRRAPCPALLASPPSQHLCSFAGRLTPCLPLRFGSDVVEDGAGPLPRLAAHERLQQRQAAFQRCHPIPPTAEAFFLLKPELVEASQQSYRMCVRRRSESSIGRQLFAAPIDPPQLDRGLFLCLTTDHSCPARNSSGIFHRSYFPRSTHGVSSNALVRGPGQSVAPISRWLGGNGNRGPCSRRPRREQPQLSFIDPSPQLLAGATLV
jgi:hypothetical protein